MFKKRLFKLPAYEGPTEPVSRKLTIAKIRHMLSYYDNPRILKKFTAAVLTSEGNFAIGTPTLIIVNGDNIDVEFESAVCRCNAKVDGFVVVNELGECVARKNFGYICRKGDTVRFNYYIQPEPEWIRQ